MVRALDDGYADEGAEKRLKVPPNSIEAEQALIGGLMLNAQAWDKVADVVSAGDFYRKDHRLIFESIGNLIEDGSPCDVVTVSEYLDNRGELEQAGGLEYLAKKRVRCAHRPTHRGGPRPRGPTDPGDGWRHGDKG